MSNNDNLMLERFVWLLLTDWYVPIATYCTHIICVPKDLLIKNVFRPFKTLCFMQLFDKNMFIIQSILYIVLYIIVIYILYWVHTHTVTDKK